MILRCADPPPICPLNFVLPYTAIVQWIYYPFFCIDYYPTFLLGHIARLLVRLYAGTRARARSRASVRLVSGILEYKLFMPWLTIARNPIRFCRVPLH